MSAFSSTPSIPVPAVPSAGVGETFRRAWRGLAGFALAYAALSFISLRLVAVDSAMTPLWPPAGIMLAGLLLLEDTPLWMVFLAAFVGQRLSVKTLAVPSAASLVLVAAACLEGWIGRVVIRRISGRLPTFERVREVIALLGGTALAVTLSGLVAGMVRADSIAAFRHSFLNWCIGGGLGILMVTPFVVGWLRPATQVALPRRTLAVEAGGVVLLTVLTTYAAFRGVADTAAVNVPPYALVGPLLWGALRFGVRGVTLQMLLVAGVAAPLQFVPEVNVLGGTTPEYRLLRLQLFLAFMTVMGLLVAAALTERHAAAAAETRAVEAMLDSERRLQQVQKLEAVGQLAGGVAHDFNNILAAMALQAHELRQAEGLSAAERGTARELHDAIRRASALTRQLLLVGRRQARENRPVNLAELVGSVAGLLRRLLPESVRLDFRPPTIPLQVQGDPSMLEQVVMNLVVNARDAMEGRRNSRVTIELQERLLDADTLRPLVADGDAVPGAFAILRVTDTGGGIPTELQAQVFEPFFTTKEQGKGTGLGLSMVFGIARQHHGFVQLVASGPEGSVFEVGLPLRAGAASEAGGFPSASVSALAATATPVSVAAIPAVPGGALDAPAAVRTILLVEDDDGVRRVVERVLKRGGWRVIAAEHGADVLERWEAIGPVDVLVTDLVLPGGVGGAELAARLRERMPALRVVYTSGYDPAYGSHGVEMTPGVNFLPKPFSAELLLGIVQRQLQSAP